MTQSTQRQNVISVSIVGHTNVGKTSLMRTLTRDVTFGEVASSPGTTRIVERATLPVAEQVLEFFDTPGLEDSASLLAHLENQLADKSIDWVEAIAGLPSDPAATRFLQEAKALRQVLDSDVVFYVIDVRDAVRAKHRDELEILMRCARPIVAVLNFVAQSQAGEASWRETLARTNIHAISLFDTVVYDEEGEIALYEKARTLCDGKSAVFTQRIEDIRAGRTALLNAGAGVVADLIRDIGHLEYPYSVDDQAAAVRQADALKSEVLKRETTAARALLKTFRFGKGDYLPPDFLVESSEWSADPFDAKVLSEFGVHLGKAAATGAAIGLGVDILVGGMTLGGAAATGALVGTGIDSARRYGKGLKERFTGRAVLQIEIDSFAVIAARQLSLLKALRQRGHGAQGDIDASQSIEDMKTIVPFLKASLSQRLDAAEYKALMFEIERLVRT